MIRPTLGAIALLVTLGCTAAPKAAPQAGGSPVPSAGPSVIVAAGAASSPEPSPSVPPGCTPPSPAPANAAFAPGEVLFKFKATISEADLEAFRVAKGLQTIEALRMLNTYKATFAGPVRQKVVDIACDERIEFAEPNYIMTTQLGAPAGPQ